MKLFFGIMLFVGMIVMPFFLSSNVLGASNKAEIRINYSGSWSGNVGGDNSRSVEGIGGTSYIVEGDTVVAVIQKDDDSSERLTVSIYVKGELKEIEKTTAGYGIVTVSYSFPLEDREGAEGGVCSTVFASIFVFIAAGGYVFANRRLK